MPSKSIDSRPQTSPAAQDDALPVLSFDEIASDDAPALIARGAAYVREFADVENRPEVLTRSLAVVLIALRRIHDDPRGRKHAYRMDAAEIYRSAGIPSKTEGNLQQAVRWHVGNMLREVLTAGELEEHGLLPDSPLERLQTNRKTTAALLTAAKVEHAAKPKPQTSAAKKGKKGASVQETIDETETGSIIRATADHLRLASAALNVLSQLSPDVITRDMTPGQSAKLDDELAEIQSVVSALRRHSRKRRSDA
ncbi:hypothetical protein [Streptomyces chryseus]|uniref:hypothetical protein n=1 Tax=Streptomyces chryseus TaxID=68186 RepID=UPI00110FE806|nr:hypothetical protein [Streptomyces chryseus]GGX26877.1 hypothetical protein GCM10010353_47540 [Streptomyces chryseus]